MAAPLGQEEIGDLLFMSDDSDIDPNYSPDEDDNDEEQDIQDLLADMAIDEEEEEDGINENINRPIWTEFQNRTSNFAYTGNGGLRRTIPADITPAQVFNLLVDDEVITEIVNETNTYALQCISAQPNTRSSTNQWKPTDKEEILKYLGLIMWMGLVKVGKLANYWSTNPLYKNLVASNTMPRNRFQAILRHIHFANNEMIEPNDKLGKIQPLIDKLQDKFQKLYTPEDSIVIDESLVPWRGRLVFRQYLPAKAHKYGIKVFKLCSSEGYCWSLQVYGGKSATGGREVGQALRVCKDLTVGLRNKGRTLYVDNLYTSYAMARFFLEEQTHVVGTLRANGVDMPKEVLEKKLKKGEMIYREEQHGIVVLKWKDTRDVRLLTTKHQPEMEEIAVRPATYATNSTSNVQTRPRKRKPTAIIDYNKGKAGIDLSDQMASYACVLRKGVKWYRKLAMELLLGVSVVNAYVIYKKATNSKIGIREFRENLAVSLLSLSPERRHIQPSILSPHVISEVENKSAKTRRRCVLCYEQIQRTEGREVARKRAKLVNTLCVSCGNKPFCISCFGQHHTKK